MGPNDYGITFTGGPAFTGTSADGDVADYSWIPGGSNAFPADRAGEDSNRIAGLLDAKAADYGAPEANFERIAQMWSALFGRTFSPTEVGLAMIVVKLTREQFAHKDDNITDIEGYAECIRRVTANDAPATTATLTPGSPGSARSYR